jgi:hypothetical protein
MDAPTLVSAAFFGLRSDRDTLAYYSTLLNDLAGFYPGRVIVYTNEPGAFGSRIQAERVNDLRPFMAEIWPDTDWEAQVLPLLSWHKRNRRLAQWAYPRLLLPWLAKLGLVKAAAQRHGPVFWLDAGLLYSVDHGRSVPARPVGYDPARVSRLLLPALAEAAGSTVPTVATVPRKGGWLKSWRPTFHGLSRRDMARLARRCGAAPDDRYTVGAVAYWPSDWPVRVIDEGADVWRKMLDMGRIGTEETVLSVLRWKHGWHGRPVGEWCRLMAPAPGE